MAKIISIMNKSEGVGTTSSVINISAIMVRLGFKVLIIDFDPELGLSYLILSERSQRNTLFDVLHGANIEDCIAESSVPGVDILFSGHELGHVSQYWEHKARLILESLRNIEDTYDFIILDCPSSYSQLQLIAMSIAHSIVIPIFGIPSYNGAEQLVNDCKRINVELNNSLEIDFVFKRMTSSNYFDP